MFAGSQVNDRFSLTATKMPVIVVGRDRIFEIGQTGIDEKVMMAGIGLIHTSGGDSYTRYSENNLDWRCHDLPMLGRNNVSICPFGCGRIAGKGVESRGKKDCQYE